MGQMTEFQDILDAIEETPGWRFEKLDSKSWRIYPADRTQEIIHTRPSGDTRYIDNLKSQLRRAGCTPFIRQPKKANMPAVSGQPTSQLERVLESKSAAKPRNLINEARMRVNNAITELSELEKILNEIGVEQERMSQLKLLLSQIAA